jgi:membrane protein DedA with SNARE-associated domain
LWAGTWVSLGYLAGHHIATIYHSITQYSSYLLVVLAVVLAGYIIWHVLRSRRRQTSSAGELRQAQQDPKTTGS